MGNLTGASVVLSLSIVPLFPVPQQLQGFASDDVTDIPAIKTVETVMGVDGKQSEGFVFVSVPMPINLQGDSISNLIFDVWNAQQVAGRTRYRAQGLLLIPAIATKWTLTGGALTSYKPAPAVKKMLQARAHEITWESVVSSPMV